METHAWTARRLILCLIYWIAVVGCRYVSACRTGWTPDYRVKACFKLFDKVRLDWSDAKSFCIKRDAYLCDMLDFDEQKFINDSLLTGKHINKGVWMGATDRKTGRWRWVNGASMDIDLFLWRPGNPNNGKVWIEIPDVGQDCLQMSTEPGRRGQLNDYYCKREFHFICKDTDMFIETTSVDSTSAPTSQTSPINKTNTVEIVSLTAALLVVSVAVIIFIIVYRKRKRQRTPHTYQDTVELSINENVYTGLDETGTNTNHGEANYYETLIENSSACTIDDNITYQTLERVNSNENVYTALDANLQNNEDTLSNNNTKSTEKVENTAHRHDLNTTQYTSGYLDMDSRHYEVPKTSDISSHDKSRDNESFVPDYVEPDCANKSPVNATNVRREESSNTYYITPTFGTNVK